MKQFLLSVVLLLMACASARAQTTAAANGADPASTFGACVGTNSVIVANNCSGATLGLKVNAADAALGSNPGEIWVHGGGAFGDENSRITISSKHMLRIFSGTYRATGYNSVILLKDDSSLICESPQTTILQEPTHATVASQDMFNIVASYGMRVVAGAEVGEPNKNISIKGCRFVGAAGHS